MYKIIIDGLKIFAFHGVNPEEKIDGQTFEIDAVLKVDNNLDKIDDNINNTVSYSKVIKVIKSAMLVKSYDLIESVAYYVEKAIFDEFEAISEIEITVKKPQAPISADVNFVAVNLKNNRSEFYV